MSCFRKLRKEQRISCWFGFFFVGDARFHVDVVRIVRQQWLKCLGVRQQWLKCLNAIGIWVSCLPQPLQANFLEPILAILSTRPSLTVTVTRLMRKSVSVKQPEYLMARNGRKEDNGL